MPDIVHVTYGQTGQSSSTNKYGMREMQEKAYQARDAKYLLLRRNGESTATDLYEIKSKGPKVFSTVYLDKLKYPSSKKPKDYYLAIEIQKVTALEFENVSWDFKELEEYKTIQEIIKNPYSKVGMPFTVSLTKLMKVKTPNNKQIQKT
jgi:Fic family protein